MISKTDKIVITGATGLLGSYILRYFYKQGFTNIYASRRKHSRLDLIGDIADKVVWIEADVLDFYNLEKLIEGAAMVIHTAAMVSFQNNAKDRMTKVNVEGTANIVNLCLDHNVQKLLYVSSIAAIGKNEVDTIINEDQEWEDNDLNTPYAISKYLAELEVWRGKEEGLEVAMLNPGVVLGAGRWSDSSLAIVSTVAKGVKFYPTGMSGLVDVRDVAKMMYLLYEKNISGKRIIAVAENYRIRDMIWSIADKISVPRASIKVTKWMIPVVWRIARLIAICTNTKAFITRDTLHSTSREYAYDNSRSQSLLGISYIPIEKTIEDMCTAYNESVERGLEFGIYDI